MTAMETVSISLDPTDVNVMNQVLEHQMTTKRVLVFIFDFYDHCFLSSQNVERTVFRTINVIIMKVITTHNIYKYISSYLPIITD